LVQASCSFVKALGLYSASLIHHHHHHHHHLHPHLIIFSSSANQSCHIQERDVIFVSHAELLA
jgi:hypothetical protein